ncbi:MAG TPA: xanthine dehydrogenase accessory protein XdhC [Steroidobacter sp.]|uniref:xanthine dehydrogenase accessory protein XdhC n=1 Tax=Steroidobacter sp. TaxID=1978227 RepID=UPI002EDA0BC8
MIAALTSPAENPASIGQWLTPLASWPAAAVTAVQATGSVVRIVVASTRGSSPRAAGTCMLVDRERIVGTIGGGQLEWSAIASARNMLATPGAAAVQLRTLVLGPQLAQCCGGVVELWMERYTSADLAMLDSAERAAARGQAFLVSRLTGAVIERRVNRHPALDEHARRMARAGTRLELVRENDSISLHERLDEDRPAVWLYGAGHVGQALARVLVTLPMRLTWIDSRPEFLPTGVPAHILVSELPVATVRTAPPGTRFVIMTHSHQLDYELCKAVLERGDQAWVGVIGSRSKSARFRSRLCRDGLEPEHVARLTCPMGVDAIESKEPAAIAISVAAQLLQTLKPAPTRTVTEAHECVAASCRGCGHQPGNTP